MTEVLLSVLYQSKLGQNYTFRPHFHALHVAICHKLIDFVVTVSSLMETQQLSRIIGAA